MGWATPGTASSDASIIATKNNTITALEDRLDAIHAAAVEAAQADGIAWFAAVDRLLEVCQQSNNRPKVRGC